MQLYSDKIIKLDYIPESDTLSVTLQEERVFDVAEVRAAFLSIVTTIREHNISRLLLDFTRNTLDLRVEEYKNVIAQLTVGLMQTQLKKVARVGTDDPVREQKIADTYDEIKSAVPVPIEVKFFSERAEALDWLTA